MCSNTLLNMTRCLHYVPSLSEQEAQMFFEFCQRKKMNINMSPNEHHMKNKVSLALALISNSFKAFSPFSHTLVKEIN